MPFYLFLWTPEIEAHVNEHGISAEEFELIVKNPWRVEPSRSSDRLIAFGEIDGRLVACVYEDYDPYIEPVTAYYIED